MQDFPWIYPYQEEKRPAGSFIIEPLLRPAVIIRFEGARLSDQNVVALVDSGSDHLLAAQWIAQDIGVVPDPTREMILQVGGAARKVRFADVRINLLPPGSDLHEGGYDSREARSFEAQVGFFLEWASPPWMAVLGQNGFFDRFTVTMSRHAQALAVDDVTDFDRRYPQDPKASRYGPGRGVQF